MNHTEVVQVKLCMHSHADIPVLGCVVLCRVIAPPPKARKDEE
jgi:hypothetical protein